MKTTHPRLRCPDLSVAAQTARHLRQPVVIVSPSRRDTAEIDRLKARVRELESAATAALDRAHREERVKANTLRVVDNRAAWAAKLGIRRPPLVAITPTRVITADIWQSGHPDDE